MHHCVAMQELMTMKEICCKNVTATFPYTPQEALCFDGHTFTYTDPFYYEVKASTR